MFKISEAFAIALHSMVFLASRPKEIVPIKAISERFSISANHLSKILQRLIKSGFITSTKGIGGGFRIVPQKKNISFFDVYKAIERDLKASNCIFQSKKTKCHTCIMGTFVCKMNKDFYDYLKNTKISDFSL